MGVRSVYLRHIESELRLRGVDARIDSIPALRSALPSYRGRLLIRGLIELKTLIQSATDEQIRSWRLPPLGRSEKAAIVEAEVLRLKADSLGAKQISDQLGITRVRVHQILKKAEHSNKTADR